MQDHREGEGYRIPYGSEPISASDPLTHEARMRFMESVKNDPNFLGAMAVAEIGQSGVILLGTVAEMPEAISGWHNYLTGELGFDLAKLGNWEWRIMDVKTITRVGMR